MLKEHKKILNAKIHLILNATFDLPESEQDCRRGPDSLQCLPDLLLQEDHLL